MKLLLDEMHAPGIATRLTDESFDVLAVASQPTLRGMTDGELFTCAIDDERALVTENVADFMPLAAELVGAGRSHAGLIFTNPKRFNRANLAYPGDVIAALREFLTIPPITGKSWIWWL